MQQAGLAGEYLPWRDVLHEGPVPSDLNLQQLSDVRAQYIADVGWADIAQLRVSFSERDQTLMSYRDYDHIILWFEHDLYDQLHILQLLDWFSDKELGNTRLSLICTENYLGMVTPKQLMGLKTHQQLVSDQQLQLAKLAWSAFRSSSPVKWYGLLAVDTSVLPFLRGAILRLLEEYPDSNTGLSRTARSALEIIAGGEHRPERVFGLYQATEDRRFMGDSSFWQVLTSLLQSEPPLLTLPQGKTLALPVSREQTLTVTQHAQQVLAGELSFTDTHTQCRWLGGVELSSDNNWRWNSLSQALVEP